MVSENVVLTTLKLPNRRKIPIITHTNRSPNPRVLALVAASIGEGLQLTFYLLMWLKMSVNCHSERKSGLTVTSLHTITPREAPGGWCGGTKGGGWAMGCSRVVMALSIKSMSSPMSSHKIAA